ncbi:heme-binding protein [Saccharophagus degradans]|uniref:GlcG/HbpS family heme-binding protein n=1 Tax=Saccharophagus degradans TaxID=86304 RepID=UPI001C0A23B6|nr:heme-binding protein [Saccharophagus degradans]MBU2985322.1 heme-binding protein [Saccharophagus degradans]
MRGLSLRQALTAIDCALGYAQQQSLPPLTMVVLDAGAHVKACASADGSGTQRYEIALGKASAALGMGFGTRTFSELVKKGTLPAEFSSAINGATHGRFIPLPGGVLIFEQGQVVGAIGISGASSNADEEVAIAAIEQCGLTAGL